MWVARGGPPSTIPRHCAESFSVLYAVISCVRHEVTYVAARGTVLVRAVAQRDGPPASWRVVPVLAVAQRDLASIVDRQQSLSIYVWLHVLGCCAGTHGARMVHVLLAVSCVSVEPACIWTSRMKTSPLQVSFLAAAYVRGPAENVLYCNVAVPKAVCEWFLAEEYPRYGRCGTARQRGIRGRRAVPQPEAPFPWASGTRRWLRWELL